MPYCQLPRVPPLSVGPWARRQVSSSCLPLPGWRPGHSLTRPETDTSASVRASSSPSLSLGSLYARGSRSRARWRRRRRRRSRRLPLDGDVSPIERHGALEEPALQDDVGRAWNRRVVLNMGHSLRDLKLS
ncbi:hypothetical protein GUJ93_ZPchr0002g24610 [Zizania palustris]|uniref:Uncharacterized protein n=1 Tax=Zizania palustris TaxID=103762 RepID=A0A8J5VW23_ZIZPA|nr:hypothetical protein GUJ93_ZPchr0002g24610 [Zizania palustris]